MLLVGSGVYHLHHDLPHRHDLPRLLLRKALRHLLRSCRPHLRLSHLDLRGTTEFRHMVYKLDVVSIGKDVERTSNNQLWYLCGDGFVVEQTIL